jgi:hypothetical protein
MYQDWFSDIFRTTDIDPKNLPINHQGLVLVPISNDCPTQLWTGMGMYSVLVYGLV